MNVEKTLFYHWDIVDLTIGLFMFYFWGKYWGKNLDARRWMALGLLVVGVAAGAAFMTCTYGYHFEGVEQHEGWREGRWEKDFEPTREERFTYGLQAFFFFLASSLIGYATGRQKALELEESYQRLYEKTGIRTT